MTSPWFGRLRLVRWKSRLRQRNNLEQRYLYNIPGFGRLIAKDDKLEFKKLIKAFQTQLDEYSKGIRDRLEAQTSKIIAEAIALSCKRSESTGGTLDAERLKEEIQKSLDRVKDEESKVKLVFKDVTYEQTRDQEFRNKVDKALPQSKRKQLGEWNQDFDAAKAATRTHTS